MFIYLGKRSFGMMEDGHDDFLSQAVNRNQREEIDLDDGIDHILSHSFISFIFFLLTCLKKRTFWMTQSISPTCLRVVALV